MTRQSQPLDNLISSISKAFGSEAVPITNIHSSAFHPNILTFFCTARCPDNRHLGQCNLTQFSNCWKNLAPVAPHSERVVQRLRAVPPPALSSLAGRPFPTPAEGPSALFAMTVTTRITPLLICIIFCRDPTTPRSLSLGQTRHTRSLTSIMRSLSRLGVQSGNRSLDNARLQTPITLWPANGWLVRAVRQPREWQILVVPCH